MTAGSGSTSAAKASCKHLRTFVEVGRRHYGGNLRQMVLPPGSAAWAARSR